MQDDLLTEFSQTAENENEADRFYDFCAALICAVFVSLILYGLLIEKITIDIGPIHF